MRMFRRENGECDVIDEICPYKDRTGYKENCYHCLLYNAAVVVIEKSREKEAKNASK